MLGRSGQISFVGKLPSFDGLKQHLIVVYRYIPFDHSKQRLIVIVETLKASVLKTLILPRPKTDNFNTSKL
jgi:hypothetical protein